MHTLTCTHYTCTLLTHYSLWHLSACLGLNQHALESYHTVSLRFHPLRTLGKSGHTLTADRIGQGQATHPTKGRSGRDQAGDRDVFVFTTLARVNQLRLEALSYSPSGITHTTTRMPHTTHTHTHTHTHTLHMHVTHCSF